METPNVLYHGSLYKQNELMPGIKRSGELTVWDGVETNQNLYATTDRQAAALLGIGSAAEKTFDTDRFIENEGDIWLFSQKPIELDDFLKMVIYRYTIPVRPQDGWKKNNNPYNNIDTEWITQKTINGVKCEQLDIREVMKGHKVTVTKAPVDVALHEITTRYGSDTKVYKL